MAEDGPVYQKSGALFSQLFSSRQKSYLFFRKLSLCGLKSLNITLSPGRLPTPWGLPVHFLQLQGTQDLDTETSRCTCTPPHPHIPHPHVPTPAHLTPTHPHTRTSHTCTPAHPTPGHLHIPHPHSPTPAHPHTCTAPHLHTRTSHTRIASAFWTGAGPCGGRVVWKGHPGGRVQARLV